MEKGQMIAIDTQALQWEERFNEKLGRGFGIHHTTIQLEHVVCETAHACVIAVREEERSERDHAEHDRHDHGH